MKNVFHYGCSFTENIRTFRLENLFTDKFAYRNYGQASSGNQLIFDTFKETVQPDSIAIIQWSSLTRQFDKNFDVLQKSDNPLYDYLEEWYSILHSTRLYAEEHNIKLLQYFGWAQWKDSELNDYHREKLKSFGIHWFTSIKQWDIISSNCFQLQTAYKWSSLPKNLFGDNYYFWSDIVWGGMSEWVRSNVDILNRYRGWTYAEIDRRVFDSHPSELATMQFIKQFLLVELEKF